MEIDRIIRLPELEQITGLSRATIYRRIASGEFPQAVALGANARGWRASAVIEWLEGLAPAGSTTNAGDAGRRPASKEPAR